MRLERQLGPIFERKALGTGSCSCRAPTWSRNCPTSPASPRTSPRNRRVAGNRRRRPVHRIQRGAQLGSRTQPAASGVHTGGDALVPRHHGGGGRRTRRTLEHPRRRGSVDVSSDMTKLTLETIGGRGSAIRSIRFAGSGRTRSSRHGPALTHAQRRTFRKVPLVSKLLYRRSDRQNEQDTAYLAQVVDEVIRQRRDSDAEGPEDLLEIMLRAARGRPESSGRGEHSESGRDFPGCRHETRLRAPCRSRLHYLAQHPEILAKARAEVDAVWGDGTPTFEQVAKLRYVRRVWTDAAAPVADGAAYARERGRTL